MKPRTIGCLAGVACFWIGFAVEVLFPNNSPLFPLFIGPVQLAPGPLESGVITGVFLYLAVLFIAHIAGSK